MRQRRGDVAYRDFELDPEHLQQLVLQLARPEHFEHLVVELVLLDAVQLELVLVFVLDEIEQLQ